MKTRILGMIFVIVALFSSTASFEIDAAQQQQNPASVWCDYHNASFIKSGVEFPSGNCYDVYKHNYYDRDCKCTRVHKMTMKCPK